MRWPKLPAPGSNRCVGYGDAALRERILDIAKLRVNRSYSQTAWLMISGGKRWRRYSDSRSRLSPTAVYLAKPRRMFRCQRFLYIPSSHVSSVMSYEVTGSAIRGQPRRISPSCRLRNEPPVCAAACYDCLLRNGNGGGIKAIVATARKRRPA